MLQQTLTQRYQTNLLWRVIAILGFTVLTAISARVTVEIGTPVPFTLQVLVVLLAGMVLGARDGALSQLAYLALIAINLPYDARGLGSAALFGPTGGFLVGFVFAAGVVGFIVERAAKRWVIRFLAGLAGVAVIYTFGVAHLAAYAGMDLGRAWTVGAQPFVALDIVKAFLAAGLTESVRYLLNRR